MMESRDLIVIIGNILIPFFYIVCVRTNPFSEIGPEVLTQFEHSASSNKNRLAYLALRETNGLKVFADFLSFSVVFHQGAPALLI